MKNLESDVFGRLIALKMVRVDIDSHTYWACRCICGNFTVVRGSRLVNNRTKSCGCLRLETRAKKKIRKGD